MENRTIHICEKAIPIVMLDSIVIGSGCAGLNAADVLYDYGRRDIGVLTEGLLMGTSRNTGSDKQTFYKLSLAQDEPDSIGEMADTLYNCGGMHGDIALVEASCSVRSFMKLVNYGVPFPTDQFGAHIGYKTDHDPRRRATSAGPYTSKFMTEKLEQSVITKGIRIFDHISVIRLLVFDECCYGALAIDEKQTNNGSAGLVVFLANNVVMATGGPAGIYATSVYPNSQTGMTGMAIEAGAKCENLMDWQYGIASTKFRWNVSGTYQQVIPRYISIDKDGNEREFLLDYFDDPLKALEMVFLKGYQWPFDVRKINNSSMIDIIVHHETSILGNRVYMDFTHEPTGLDSFDNLSKEAYDYLRNSNALIKFPIERLAHMNFPAIQLFRDNGIDLFSEPLEVKVCAQHNNGGIAVDEHWQSSIKNLYVVGEAAGTFGAYRPGGTALASTQTGSLRAAEHICFTTHESVPDSSVFVSDIAANSFIQSMIKLAVSCTDNASNVVREREMCQKELSASAAHIRNKKSMEELFNKRLKQISDFFELVHISSPHEISQLLRNRDILFTQLAVISAMLLTAEKMGSRGSGLLVGDEGLELDCHIDSIHYTPAIEGFDGKTVVTHFRNNDCTSCISDTRPIPTTETWFENAWKEYLEQRKGIS
jgi:Succinate dehydrogenase/fumarate reductase, flavoprotein subunit